MSRSTTLLAADAADSLALGSTVSGVTHGIVSRAVLTTTAVRVVLFAFAPEQMLTEHTSTARALIQVLSGEAEFTLAGAPRRIQAGDLLHLPPNVPHAVRALTAMTMLLTLVPERPVG